MGKKAKKTRWRTLTLNGHAESDSEESWTKSSKFFYSSHSSPVRKFQNDASSQSTRSNSTTSEQKATFNEDEYTRITTPRQDVLFKKGYLNKPKSYQTQTSTGASSTSTCTPDHQSADGTEEYESQLVFPNGFIDHNGIYYINSFEPFPFVVYNAPICYPDYLRTKRYSTDSLTESISPQNEESVATQPSDEASADEEPRRQKKKRRRKISRSKSITSQESTDSGEIFKTDDDAAKKTYALKPDAEEFVPRNWRVPEALMTFDPNVHFVNFIPVPFVGDLPRPPLLPINFIPSEPAAYVENNEIVVEKKNNIDIAKIVLKLEEAAKQQKIDECGRRQRGGFAARQRFSRYRKISEVVEKAPPSPTKKLVVDKPQNAFRRTNTTQEKKPVIRVVATPARAPLKTNQWISVSSRKKRKNKSATEDGDDNVAVNEDVPEENDDLFESFDVNQLVDVVPPSQLEVANVETTEPAAQPEPEPSPTKPKKKKPIKKAEIKRVMVIDAPLPPAKKPEPPKVAAEAPARPEPKTPEKKKKKKKKPQPHEAAETASNATSSNGDDTYDFLLETAVLNQEKTNVEISQELDRMIQKGILSHLEEKIKAMNLNSSDDFFKTVAESSWNSQEFPDKAFHLNRF